MKKITKVFAVLTCAALAFSFWSCDNGNKVETYTVTYEDGVDDADVYKALRVSMVCGGKKILWAPYTGESTLYYLNKATTLAEGKQYDVDGTEKGESKNKY